MEKFIGFNTMKAIYIEWLDTVKISDWAKIGEDKPDFSIPTKTIGWFIGENDKAITIALSHDEETGTISCFKHIPKITITKRKWIKI